MSLESLVFSRELSIALDKRNINIKTYCWFNSYDQKQEHWITCNFKSMGNRFGMPNALPAYTLGDIPEVLKHLGEKIGWEVKEKKYGFGVMLGWYFHWFEFCRLYVDEGKESAEKYILGLL